MSSPELAVRQLARLPSNCTCPNCGTWSRYGFSSVCMKYLTFVCDKCKSSHQAISHRCKSLTMSSWDHGEALKLKVHGNDYARKVWLATAPPPGVGGRPKEGDDIDVFKRFVVDAYERRRYYRDPAGSDGGEGRDRGADVTGAAKDAKDVVSMTVRPSMPSSAPAINAAPVHTPSTIAPAPAPVVDLLDFGAFDTPAPALATVINSAPQAASPSDAFFDPFNNNSAAMAAIPSSQCTSAATNNTMTSNTGANQANNIMSFDAFAPSSKGRAMATNATSSLQSNNATSDPFGVAMATNNANSDPFSVLAATSTMPTNNSWGTMPTNPNSMSNFNNSSTMMNGGMTNFASNNMMPMNGGGTMNNANAMMMMMMMNGNNNAMNSNNAMMMKGGFNNMIHNGGANTAMMNSMSNGGSMMPGSMQQYNRPPPQSTMMNNHTGSSMFNNNSISNNFSAGSVAEDTKTAARTSSKPDPFAGLMGL